MCPVMCEHNSKKHHIVRTFYPGGGGWCGRSGGGRGRWGGCFDGEGGLPTSGRGSEHPGALQGDHSSGWGCHSAMVVKEPCGGGGKQPSFLTLFIKGIVALRQWLCTCGKMSSPNFHNTSFHSLRSKTLVLRTPSPQMHGNNHISKRGR